MIPVDFRDIFLFSAIVIIILTTLFLTWGKMQLGDNTTELTYGTMIKAGMTPYKDFYLHVMPFTAYLARLIEGSKFPIHFTNIIGVINLIVAVIIVGCIGKILKLSFFERVLGFFIFLGVYTITLLYFNHHSFDITLSASVVMFVLFILKSAEKTKTRLFCVLAAIGAVTTFFVTQTYGLAAMVLGPFVLLLDFLLNKNKASARKLALLAVMEIITLSAVLALFALAGRISVAEMFKATFSTGYEQYTSTYGYGTIWRTSIQNIQSFSSKRFSKSATHNGVGVSQETVPITSEFLFKPALADNLFNKIFIKKSSLLNSFVSLASLVLMIVMAIQFCYMAGKQLAAKQPIDQFILVWGAIIGIFFASSILVFSLNFSGFFVIFLLWLYALHQMPLRLQKFLGDPAKLVFGFFGAMLLISNLAILRYEYKTRQYYVSKTANETVWASPLYTRDFVNQFKLLADVIDKEPSSQKFAAYPRASEIYYLLGKVPPPGFPMVSFYRPGGAYSSTLNIAEKSDVVIIFEPAFWVADLGEEHRFAMRQIQPALDDNFNLFFSSEYFKVYKRK